MHADPTRCPPADGAATLRFAPAEGYPEAARRIAATELEAALAELDGPAPEALHEAVHSARKRLKRVRALLRLNPPTPRAHFQRANAAARDAGREISETRDALALAEAFDRLREREPIEGGELIAAALGERAEAAALDLRLRDRIDSARELIAAERDRIPSWSLSEEPATLAAALGRTYRRGRRRYEECAAATRDATLHEWRKQVKYLWTQLELVTPAAPKRLGPLAGRVHDLSDALGDDHDLALLAALLTELPGTRSHNAAEAIRGGRESLQRRALEIAAGVYGQPPERFGGRIERELEAWRARSAGAYT